MRPCTAELFYEVVKSDHVARTIENCHKLYKKDKNAYDREKKRLPTFIFMSMMTLNRGKEGKWRECTWRLQSAAKLNGLVMLDFDKLSEKGTTPKKVFDSIPMHWFDFKSSPNAVMLAHVTPSGDGLRLVCLADPQRGDLAANQQYIATCLGLTCDKCVKNADRTSFAVRESDIYYINHKIFDYDNEEFDILFGDQYRGQPSAPARQRAAGCNKAVQAAPACARPAEQLHSGNPDGSAVAGSVAAAAAGEDGRQEAGAAAPVDQQDVLTYHDVAVSRIVEVWLRQHGAPEVGDRHDKLLQLASDMRHICDNQADKLYNVVLTAPFVTDMVNEGAEKEIRDACEGACKLNYRITLPKRLAPVLRELGIDKRARVPSDQRSIDDVLSMGTAAHDMFWRRLKPLLAPPYDVCCDGVSDQNKLGAVFVAGTMYCTLMTRCYYEHYDGKMWRMNPQAYIIGMPGCGKSFAADLNAQLMAPMKMADKAGREAEKAYKAQKRERENSKASKGDPLKRPELMIRYLPSKTSNHIFFRRTENAVEEINGEMMHLHLYFFDSELDSNTSAQKGGSWIGKHDIELKAFQNEETGVDYGNTDSVNDLMEVYMNQVMTGTPISMSRKIDMSNVNDGLCSRMAIFPMVNNAYTMIERGSRTRNVDRYCKQKEWAYKFDELKGELPLAPLVDHVYNLCKQSATDCLEDDDRVIDYLRRRAPLYATWFTVPRIVARQWQEFKNTGKLTIEQSDLDFATLIFDAIIYWQDYFFGQMLEDSWQNMANASRPRAKSNRKSREAYARLPLEFTIEDACKMLNWESSRMSHRAERWCNEGLLEKLGRGKYRKLEKQA